MITNYSDMPIQFVLDGITIHALNISYGQFPKTLPVHSHGNGCYEIHYIPTGYGKLSAMNQYFDIIPNTLFVTGPHIEHGQTPSTNAPMYEYCIYLKILKVSKSKSNSHFIDIFTSTPFWFGQDQYGIKLLMAQLFSELSHHYTGYRHQAESLLSQLIVCLVRNYERHQKSNFLDASSIASDNQSIIIEEYFLYEPGSLSLTSLANKLMLSPRQTERLLLKLYGKTFRQKKAETQMSAAIILLGDKKRSITSIANELGFSSPEHFSTSFKKYYSISPSKYRYSLF